MQKTTKTIIWIAIFLLISAGTKFILSNALTGYEVKQAAEGKPTALASMTKQEYLDQVKANGGDATELCAYGKLIDQYGVKEVLSMDMRVAVDENDIDQRFYPAMQACL